MSIARRLRRFLRELGPYRAVANWRADRQFRTWRASHPGVSFADFYAARVATTLSAGRPHYTLGMRGWVPGHGAGTDFNADCFAERGQALWEQILAFGLEPHMRCVDYGCGSLRLGQHAIRYLDAGNYFGIDVVDTFFCEGLKLIPPGLIAEKRPQLAVIDDQTIARIQEWRPDFIFSNAVLQHVPPSDLGTYSERLEAMMSAETRAFVLFIAAERVKQVKAMSWAYPPEYLSEVIANAAPSLDIEIGDVDSSVGSVDGRARRVLCLTRRDG